MESKATLEQPAFEMCYHKLYIFTTCGHSCYGPIPLQPCRHATIAPMSSSSESCKIQTHPYQSLKIESLCGTCQRQRSILLERLEGQEVIRFEEWQWKVSYSVPSVSIAEQSSLSKNKAGRGSKKEKHMSSRSSWRKSQKNKSGQQ